MNDQEKFEGIKENIINENEQKYGEEIRKKYGDDTVDASNEKLRGMSQTDYQTVRSLEEEIFSLLEKACASGDPASETAQQMAAKHKDWLMYSWSYYSEEAHAGLAETYAADERFAAYYDKHVKSGAAFLRDAILIYTGGDT